MDIVAVIVGAAVGIAGVADIEGMADTADTADTADPAGAEVGIAISMVGSGMPIRGGYTRHRGVTAGVITGLAGAARTGVAAQTFADA